MVTVYTLPNCQSCNFTKKKLDKLGIPYEMKAFGDSPEAQEIAKKHGINAAPLVVAGEQVWGGYRVNLIEALV